MSFTKKTTIFFFLLFSYCVADAQPGYLYFYEKSSNINKTGMYVLGTWAITNMATGAIGWSRNTGASIFIR